MRTLEFDVTRQRLTKTKDCDFSCIVAGSEGYLKAKFHFKDTSWDGCEKAASFWVDDQEYAVLLNDNDTCDIPPEALTGEMFMVSVMGVKDNYKITTSRIKITQEVY